MEPNPYEAPDIPSDHPREEPPIVVIPAWVVETIFAVSAIVMTVGLLWNAVQ